MKCFMRYFIRIIDIIPKDISKNISRLKLFHIKSKLQISNEHDCGLWLIFFK